MLIKGDNDNCRINRGSFSNKNGEVNEGEG